MSSKTLILYHGRAGTTEKAAKLLAEKQFNESCPEELRNMAKAKGLFGGEFDFDRLIFLNKGIIKKVAGLTGSVHNIKYDATDTFSSEFNN